MFDFVLRPIRSVVVAVNEDVFKPLEDTERETLDGVKFYLDNPEAKTKLNAAETWILFRASGTEPLMRIYTESTSKEAVAKLLESGRAFTMAS